MYNQIPLSTQVYIYIYIERERERQMCYTICMYKLLHESLYIYIYICISVYVLCNISYMYICIGKMREIVLHIYI